MQIFTTLILVGISTILCSIAIKLDDIRNYLDYLTRIVNETKAEDKIDKIEKELSDNK